MEKVPFHYTEKFVDIKEEHETIERLMRKVVSIRNNLLEKGTLISERDAQLKVIVTELERLEDLDFELFQKERQNIPTNDTPESRAERINRIRALSTLETQLDTLNAADQDAFEDLAVTIEELQSEINHRFILLTHQGGTLH